MSRVLIWRRFTPGSELDIFHPTDYSGLYDRVKNEWNGQSQNWGNRLWFQGIYSAVDTGENTYDFLPDVIDPDRINQEYDFIILSLANIFCSEYTYGLRNYTEAFEKIRIPVYVIACGVQADSYDDLNQVIASVGEESKQFMRAIYNTGGEFALRGYFTKEFFDRLGFSSAVVTGCPSLYQVGPDFQVSQEKKAHSQLRPVFNGTIKPFSELLTAYPDSVFMDQCDFFYPLYQPDYLKNTDLRFKMQFFDRYGIPAARFLSEGRIMMIADMNDWSHYLKDNQFNFAFGSRIHGTIMSILSGIPATIAVHDSRTREMAEFFDIPNCFSPKSHVFSEDELLACYDRMDYTSFNQSFREKYIAYERFLKDHGIVKCINTENKFFEPSGKAEYMAAIEQKKAQFNGFYKQMERDRAALNAVKFARRIKRRLSSL